MFSRILFSKTLLSLFVSNGLPKTSESDFTVVLRYNMQRSLGQKWVAVYWEIHSVHMDVAEYELTYKDGLIRKDI